ncbi:PspA/IM30 family protein [Calycomorphotria hydatis]|uniref:Phage shock protein A n=1 Tax=Calycomorphotria hydatis TaxID=2528027 RepID=A0A517T989_9PLAN|nr:PspA/IM30 family protein [Calycomorphotria hydatis]QDT64954.1 Phage shock protein A [Calycomorphotria hydatis]
MPYFSRLTDIVTCNLSDLLKESEQPEDTLTEIIQEMESGLSGARRSVNTAAGNVQRLHGDIEEQKSQLGIWLDEAKRKLSSGDEDAARIALLRKQETEDVIAGLEQEHEAAQATHRHLETMLRALEGRLADARRKHAEIAGPEMSAAKMESPLMASAPPESVPDSRSQAIEDELAALRKELG